MYEWLYIQAKLCMNKMHDDCTNKTMYEQTRFSNMLCADRVWLITTLQWLHCTWADAWTKWKNKDEQHEWKMYELHEWMKTKCSKLNVWTKINVKKDVWLSMEIPK